jgi:acyl dehydratase
MLDMSVPSDLIHHEDIEVGRTVPFGRKVVTKEDIIRFARSFDPQPIHLDEEAAKKSMVGGLCASGFHSCAIFMRMLADDLLNHSTSLGSPGIDDVRWIKPVRPDDVLSARFTCTEKRVLGSRPDVGLSKVTFEMLNQKGETAMTWASNQLLKVRDPKPAEAKSAAPKSAGAAPPKLESAWDGSSGPAPNPDSNYFEDRVLGETYDLGSHTFAKDEILAFAQEFDPQPFHLSEEAGKASLFGGLSASGWHTTAIWIRHFVAYRQKAEAALLAKGNKSAVYGPSPGFRNVRWLKPVHPGDTLEFRARTAGLLDWKSRADRGLVQTDTQGRNQKGEIVFSIRGQILAERRTPRSE